MIDFFKHKVSALGTVHRLTIVFHPQTNATEGVKLTLRMDFRVYVGTKHRNIGTLLPPTFVLLYGQFSMGVRD